MAKAKVAKLKTPKKPKMPKVKKFKTVRIAVGNLRSFKNNKTLTKIY